MSIISRMRKQTAVVWPFLGFDGYGKPTLGPASEIAVRWDDGSEEYVTSDGTKSVSTATVYTPTRFKEGSILWLGTLASATYTAPADAHLNPDSGEVRKSMANPNLKNTETLFTCLLEPTAWRGGA